MLITMREAFHIVNRHLVIMNISIVIMALNRLT